MNITLAVCIGPLETNIKIGFEVDAGQLKWFAPVLAFLKLRRFMTI
jgi:hypothetical protein